MAVIRKTFKGLVRDPDYANLTEFRESLPKCMAALEEDPMRQYLVTRHGKPVGVFMSAKTFDALKALLTEMLEKEDQKPQEQLVSEARARMDRDNGRRVKSATAQAQPTAPAVSAQIKLIQDEVTRLQDLFQSMK